MEWLVLIAEMPFGEAFWIYTNGHHREKYSGVGHTHTKHDR